jgi:hypothetical protein
MTSPREGAASWGMPSQFVLSALRRPVGIGSILSKKSKIERHRKPRESRFLDNAAAAGYSGGQSRKSGHPVASSALPPRTDIARPSRHVSKCQQATSTVQCRHRRRACRELQRPSACSARSLHPKLIHRKNFIPRTNFGQALKVVAVSLHYVFLTVGQRLYEIRARQDHLAQEVGPTQRLAR